MTFLALEESNYAGEPVLLYEFRRGNLRLLYAAADRDITAGADTYTATAITSDGAKQKGEAVTDAFTVTAPADLTIAEWFAYTPPSDLVYLTVRRFHYGDPQAVVAWIGSVVSVNADDAGKVTITCQAVSVSLKRTGLRLAWQRGCPHALYDQNCRADKTAFGVPLTVTAIGSNVLLVSGGLSSSAHWPGGFIEWEIASGTFERRLIENTVGGNSIYPYGQMDGYTVGMGLTAYPGCLHTSIHCDTFFNNILNYGGFEFMPIRSPYDGDPIF